MLVAGGLAVGVFIAVKFTDQSAAPAHTTDQDASPSLTDTFLTMTMNTFRYDHLFAVTRVPFISDLVLMSPAPPLSLRFGYNKC